MEEGDPLFQL
ncbi:unnamed protein product [Linum tenue]|uniref:Uncharacterized protein n=1 Tax=Linum tenue TaxID=586396 RepID=A0AAV0HD96_9ROSI|nr:unnamed protein product [Linum tenue]CAI0445864.1 unnamed protein product [Linum tenue]CAI0464723.1 unnamed protein product [Linum tenue]CAI0552382.1 unnamed protein product [Linum tenue]CAI0559281.1 unnamed protein product [Linum tenue]